MTVCAYPYFKCSQCDKIKPSNEKRIIKVAYGDFGTDSQNRMTYTLHHVFICQTCLDEIETMEDRENGKEVVSGEADL